MPRPSQVKAVDQALAERGKVLTEARQQAQTQMEDYYDRGHQYISFNHGTFVWLKLHPYWKLSLAERHYHKLFSNYFGLFKILHHVGNVAYQLELPSDSKIHDVFHVSLLKPQKGVPPSDPPSLSPIIDGKVFPTPLTISCACRNCVLGNSSPLKRISHH